MSEKMNPHVSIIILNWNGWKDTIECLESIYQNNYSNYSIVLVDNNSDDESVDKIKGYCKGEIEVNSPFFRYNSKNKPIEILECETVGEIKIETVNPPFHNLFLIKNDINVGFAEGNNIGIRYALNNLNSDYILLLNNDTVVDKEFIVEMLKVSENDNEIGITGPKMYYYDSPNQIWFAGGKISWKFCRGLNIGNHEVDLGQYDNVARVEFISGCAFLIKKEVIDRIGMLDKRYFLYFEEIDWTLRASKLGYGSVFVPKGKIWHKVSQSGGGLGGKVGLYYITRNRWLFMKRWAKKTDYSIFIFFQMIMALFIPLILTIYYRNSQLFGAYYKGLFDGILNK